MIYTVVTPPESEPISISKAKDHLRVDHSDEDDYILSLIGSAREFAERFTRRALMTKTVDFKIDEFPIDVIEVSMPPLQSVSSITYIDPNGELQTWGSSNYIVDTISQPARIAPAYGKVFPSTRCQMNAVTIRAIIGYGGSSDIPKEIIQAMLQMIGHLYEHRESVDIGRPLNEVPMTTKYLLEPYRDLRFFS
ncbi:MAG: head-tail connector protein [Rickettsiales bacterium]|nr:head-tail connector protein [Pseudomonadota bacterium]MDA0966880.1 head-tail connector protein [Pseudomonadota bacterium]MDG4543555.1 head-tail connector protein [Rickettsiales bacterium]MDG4545703.1 head-tail connector protein [Rickettsiales bacterium]MDG4547524.1 head-tail connector protein [Rickettsiales bacterium]